MGSVLDDETLNGIAMFALLTGLRPDYQGSTEECDCERCKAAKVVLRVVGDRMQDIMDAQDAVKN